MRRLGVIVLGASTYDHWHALDNPRFANSANEFKRFISDRSVFGESNIQFLDLFDQRVSQAEVSPKIVEFLSETKFDDVVIYYCGHGIFSRDRKSYFVCLRGTQEKTSSSTALRIGGLADDLEESLIGKRVFVVLDACFAGSAIVEFMAAQSLVHRHLEESFPRSGVAVLTATDGRDVALAKSADRFTLFTGGLADALSNGIASSSEKPELSWRDVFDHVRSKTRARLGLEAPTPQFTQTRQSDGDITTIPFFFNEAYRQPGAEQPAQDNPGANVQCDALKPETFEDTSAPHCVVVTGELSEAAAIVRYVRLAVDSYSSEIKEASAEIRHARRKSVVGLDDANAEDQPALLQSRLDVAKAFTSTKELQAAVHALCRAEVAVFDITKMQPGVMFLLGIRSVARRGVTVCSHGGAYVHGHGLQLPFNLQMLNVAAHSNEQALAKPDPLDLIGRKIVRGLKEINALPDYLDLPAYDPVRTFGANAESFKAIPRSSKVLVLCPFSPEYEKLNWASVLQQELSAKLKLRRTGPGGRPIRKTQKEADDGPLLVRLLDVETPRLVVQTLYELIRRVDMCVVDWTNLRPNVMFELGVRLAVNRLGAVHIMAQAQPNSAQDAQADQTAPKHVNDLKRLFHIIEYSCENPSDAPFRNMVDWFDRGLWPGDMPEDLARYRQERCTDSLVYETIGATIAGEPHSISLPVVDELIERARLLSNEEEESTGTSSILYQDVSPVLRTRAEAAAIERRIAAWLYLDARHANEEILGDRQLLREFRALGNQILLWFSKQRQISNDSTSREQDKRIESRISERMKGLQASRLLLSSGGSPVEPR